MHTVNMDVCGGNSKPGVRKRGRKRDVKWTDPRELFLPNGPTGTKDDDCDEEGDDCHGSLKVSIQADTRKLPGWQARRGTPISRSTLISAWIDVLDAWNWPPNRFTDRAMKSAEGLVTVNPSPGATCPAQCQPLHSTPQIRFIRQAWFFTSSQVKSKSRKHPWRWLQVFILIIAADDLVPFLSRSPANSWYAASLLPGRKDFRAQKSYLFPLICSELSSALQCGRDTWDQGHDNRAGDQEGIQKHESKQFDYRAGFFVLQHLNFSISDQLRLNDACGFASVPGLDFCWFIANSAVDDCSGANALSSEFLFTCGYGCEYFSLDDAVEFGTFVRSYWPSFW